MFEPEFVHQFDVLRPHARSVRAKCIFADGSIGRADLQSQTRTRLRQTLPGVTGEFGLFVGGELVGQSADHTAGIEALRRHHDRFEHIGGRHHQQRNRLAFFFRHRDGCGEQFLLVVVEDLAGFKDRAATEASVRDDKGARS